MYTRFTIAGRYIANKEYQSAEEILKELINEEYNVKEMKLTLAKIPLYKNRFDVEASIKLAELEEKLDKEENNELLGTYKKNSKHKIHKSKLRFKIIRTASFCNKYAEQTEYEIQDTLLAPLGVAQIVSYLRNNGIEIEQDDLNIRIHYDNIWGKEEDKINWDVFLDQVRIIEYYNGGEDKDIESIMEKVNKKSNLLGYDVMLLSVPGIEDNVAAILFMLATAKYIKNHCNSKIVVGGFRKQSFFDFVTANNKNIDSIIINREGEIK